MIAIGMCKSQTSILSNAWRFWIYTGRNSKCCQKWCNQNERRYGHSMGILGGFEEFLQEKRRLSSGKEFKKTYQFLQGNITK